MTGNPSRKPAAVWVLLADLIVLGIGGLYGGILFLLDPSGALMGVPLSLLQDLPLRDFLLPGLFLLVVMGIAPLILAAGAWKHKRLAWQATLILGLVLLVWLGAEFVLWGYQAPIQIVTGVLDLILLGVILLPGTRRWLTSQGSGERGLAWASAKSTLSN